MIQAIETLTEFGHKEMNKLFKATYLSLCVLLGAVGCGVKGDLTLPDQQNEVPEQQSQNNEEQ